MRKNSFLIRDRDLYCYIFYVFVLVLSDVSSNYSYVINI